MQLGEKLKRLRLERKITQNTLAERLGVSRVTLSKWENGKSAPNVMVLLEYQKIFDLGGKFFNKTDAEIDAIDISKLNISGRIELKEFYDSLIKKKEYLKKS